MIEFAVAHELTGINEGIYSDSPTDPGGRTVYGIAEERPPSDPHSLQGEIHSRIFEKVDELGEGGEEFPSVVGAIEADDEFVMLSDEYYEIGYWQPLRTEIWPQDLQVIANKVFDSGVNLGVNRACKWLQLAINDLSDGGDHWNLLKVDGRMGPMSAESLRACMYALGLGLPPVTACDVVIDKMRLLQIARYAYLAERNPALKENWGWIGRALA